MSRKQKNTKSKNKNVKSKQTATAQKQAFRFDHYTMGTCYYPEHWDSGLWSDDLDRMLAVGISVIRIAEFAWSKVEPKEDEFDFTFYDSFLELCDKKGMKVIMCTPSATPPAWLTYKYPEVLNKTIDGVQIKHGARKHHVNTSEKYNELIARIVTKMAKHYGSLPCVIGWQIDNEINCEVNEYYSEADDAAFRTFLKKKYSSLDKLNDAWGTAFWNQQYTDWKEVHIPQPILSNGKNPHRYLDYYRFVSGSAREYLHMQAVILRKYIKKDAFITTNGLFGNLDNHKMTEESLDIYMYDSYPNFPFGLDWNPEYDGGLEDRSWTRKLIETRSICRNFGIMEQQSGANGWVTRMEGPAPKPGKIGLWAMQSVAQGADYISFFRWRTCTFGTEMYWHGILDYDNRDNRKLAEVADFYANLKKLDEICGAEVVSSFAVLRDYDNIWDANTDIWHKRVQEFSEDALFKAAELTHTGFDYVYIDDDTSAEQLNKYKVVFYPHPSIITKARTKMLKEYVKQGGHLIIGCRSGYKDISGKCVMTPQPGMLAQITGSDVVEFTFTSPKEADVTADFAGNKLTMPLFNDICRIRDGEEDACVLARYNDTYYEGTAAIIEKKLGLGSAIHFGAAFDTDAVKAMLQYTGILEPYKEVVDVPESVQLVVRRKGEKEYFFTLNYTDSEQTINLGRQMHNMLSEGETLGKYIMKPYEVCVWVI